MAKSKRKPTDQLIFQFLSKINTFRTVWKKLLIVLACMNCLILDKHIYNSMEETVDCAGLHELPYFRLTHL